MDLCFHKHDFIVSAEWTSAPCDGIGGAVRTTCTSKAPKGLWIIKSYYKAFLDLCENEMMSIKFLWICMEIMTNAENFEIEKWYEGGDTVPVRRSSHHLVPLSSSRIGFKLVSQD